MNVGPSDSLYPIDSQAAQEAWPDGHLGVAGQMGITGPSNELEARLSQMALYNLHRANTTMESLLHAKWSNADTASFDCMHYDGDKALMCCATDLGLVPWVHPDWQRLSPRSRRMKKILDVGSGFSASGRFLATHYSCSVTGIELQHDIHQLAEHITSRNEDSHLQRNVRSVNANFLTLEPGFHDGTEVQMWSYDHVISFLCVTHIPPQYRPRFWHQASLFLKFRGTMYIEDFFLKGKLTDYENLKMENAMPGCYIPTSEQWIAEIEAAGFKEVDFEDVSETWTEFVVNRAQDYRSEEEEDRDENLRIFYDTVAEVFASGHVGGLRLNAVWGF